VVFLPADEQDLADFLKALDPAVPVLAIGVGSNLLVRDGGVEGVMIRLGKGFNTVEALGDNRIKAGSGRAGRHPGPQGGRGRHRGAGVLCRHPRHDRRRGDHERRLLWLRDRQCHQVGAGDGPRGGGREISGDRASASPTAIATCMGADLIVLDAIFEGTADEPRRSRPACARSPSRRETTQPIREKTGGSTFKNPPGHSSWKLVDEAGWRGGCTAGRCSVRCTATS
jgi:UDP-N-acetylmuramate dehydrogenase